MARNSNQGTGPEDTAPADAPEPVAPASVPEPEADAAPLDTTIPGGRYEVNGKIVDANGNPIKE